MKSEIKNQFTRKHYYNIFKKSMLHVGEALAFALLMATAIFAWWVSKAI